MKFGGHLFSSPVNTVLAQYTLTLFLNIAFKVLHSKVSYIWAWHYCVTEKLLWNTGPCCGEAQVAVNMCGFFVPIVCGLCSVLNYAEITVGQDGISLFNFSRWFFSTWSFQWLAYYEVYFCYCSYVLTNTQHSHISKISDRWFLMHINHKHQHIIILSYRVMTWYFYVCAINGTNTNEKDGIINRYFGVQVYLMKMVSTTPHTW